MPRKRNPGNGGQQAATLLKKNKGVATPYIAWVVVFTALPLLLVIYFAFTDRDGAFTLSNLTGLAGYASVFFLSLLLAVIATALCLVIAYPISFMLSRLRSGRQGIMLMLVMLPMWMNFLLRTYAWMSLLERNGLINKFLGLFGIGPFEMINTAGAVVLGMVYNYLPYMILPLYTAMLKIQPSIIEAAEDLGAGTWHKLTRVLIPLSKPGIKTGITMVFVPSISTFIISKMLGGGNFWLIGDLIESQFLGNSYNYNLGSAMSLVLMVVVLLIMSVTGGFDSEDIEGVI
ncbi:MAG: ABC transporter permease [Ruminococcaceae bacterium]|nr:ABC transporter permease [Oscillospiraceae bacterium]